MFLKTKLLTLSLDKDLAMKCFRDNLFSIGNSVYKTDCGMEPSPCQRQGRIMKADELQFPMH